MDAVIGLLGLLAMGLGLVSVIWPLKFLRIDTRKKGLAVFGAGFLALIVGVAISDEQPRSEDSDMVAADSTTTTSGLATTTSQATTTATQQTTTTQPTTTTQATTTTQPTTTTASTTTTIEETTTTVQDDETAIENAVTDVLDEQLVDTEVISQVDGGYGVVVSMNVSDNFTMGLVADGFKADAADVMFALFRDHPQLDVQWVAVDGLFPLTDRFGNTEPGEVVSIRFERELADQVNWDTHDATLALDILPGLYDWLFIHPDMSEHLP